MMPPEFFGQNICGACEGEGTNLVGATCRFCGGGEASVVSGPSDKAVRAAAQALHQEPRVRGFTANVAVEAAYPVIRADVIAEVVEVLRTKAATPDTGDGTYYRRGWVDAADFIEQELGTP